MSAQFSVFIIKPDNLVVYSLDDKSGGQHIYNAGSLELFHPEKITGYAQVNGYITDQFGVQPFILGNEEGAYQVVYAPLDDQYVYDHERQLAKHDGCKITQRSVLLMPDVKNSVIGSEYLNPVPLEPGADGSIQTFIQLSRAGKEQTLEPKSDQGLESKSEQTLESKSEQTLESKSDQELGTQAEIQSDTQPKSEPLQVTVDINNLTCEDQNEKIPTPIVEAPGVNLVGPVQDEGKSEPAESPKKTIRSPSPRAPVEPVDSSPTLAINSPEWIAESEKWSSRVHQLEEEVEELRELVKAMNQRLYQIYPVHIPAKLKAEGKPVNIVSVKDIQERMEKGEIVECTRDPMLQAYAGSHRSQNRFLTCKSKDGQVYLVRAEYDPKENKINVPK